MNSCERDKLPLGFKKDEKCIEMFLKELRMPIVRCYTDAEPPPQIKWTHTHEVKTLSLLSPTFDILIRIRMCSELSCFESHERNHKTDELKGSRSNAQRMCECVSVWVCASIPRRQVATPFDWAITRQDCYNKGRPQPATRQVHSLLYKNGLNG